MSIANIKAFLQVMEKDYNLKEKVLSASTADDVAQIGLQYGFEFSGDELLRFSGNKVGRITVKKNDVPGEYN